LLGKKSGSAGGIERLIVLVQASHELLPFQGVERRVDDLDHRGLPGLRKS